MVDACDPAFLTVFPRATDEQRECFDLLKRAYIEARHSSAYQITKEQLEYLGARVQELQRLAQEICEAKIESYLSA
jgi:predicted transcriptional regulator